MAFDLSELTKSIPRFLEAWRIVRVCPDKIDAPNEQLSFNIFTLAVVLVIFVIARSSVAGAERSVTSDLFATIISAVIIFVTGFSVLIVDNGPDAMNRVRKWGMFFVLTWITSLLAVIAIDGIALWNHASAPTTIIINSIFVPGTLSDIAKNALRALIMGVVAFIILLLKTRFNDTQFRIVSRCSILTILFGLIVNTGLLLAFLYSNVL